MIEGQPPPELFMDASTPPGPGTRLDAISTRRSLLALARLDDPGTAAEARALLALRYRAAVRAYLGGLLSDDPDADDVAQEVVLKLLRGSLVPAADGRGRFRDYVRTAARNAARTHLARKRRRAGGPDPAELADDEPAADPDEEWLAGWRRALLDNAWAALEEHQRARRGSVAHSVLRLAADHPDESSDRLAARLSELTGRPVRADAFRQQLARARRRFAELLVAEVARTVDDPTPDRLDEELCELGLTAFIDGYIGGPDAE
jgi:RNA polymerase sigma factor (sigma-70 family)